MANGVTRTNDLVFTGRPGTYDEAAFGAFIENQAMHTFHHHMIVLRQDRYQPYSEYMVPAHCGFDVFSQIADIANASVVTNDTGDPAYTGALQKLNENTPVGKRRPLLYITAKLARQLHTKAILQAQTERPFREIKWIADERFPTYERTIPIVAARGSRPVICPTKDFRTSALSAMTPTWLQAQNQMTPAVVNHQKVARADVAMFKIPPHGFAYAKGAAGPSMGSFLGLNGAGKFKQAMRMERRDLLVAAAMATGCIKHARQCISDFEAEQPLRKEDTYAIRNQRYQHQQQLSDYWGALLDAKITPVVAFDTLQQYREKFPYNFFDYGKSFRKLVQEAMDQRRDDPRDKNFPVLIRSEPELKHQLRDTFFDKSALPAIQAEIPSYEESMAMVWNYSVEDAPMQVTLQRKTSELTLNSLPSVEVMTQLEISAAKTAERIAADKKRDKDHSNVLSFTEEILKAHLFEGTIFASFTPEEKTAFKEQVNNQPHFKVRLIR